MRVWTVPSEKAHTREPSPEEEKTGGGGGQKTEGQGASPTQIYHRGLGPPPPPNSEHLFFLML